MISDLFAQFIKEKRYIANLSERTIHSYQNHVFKRWMKYVGEMPTAQNLTQFVIKMREDGLSPTTCNITIRSFNSFLAWLHSNGHTPPLKLQQLKTEKRIMKTFTEDQMKTLLKWRPDKTRNQVRLYVVMCALADTGIRIAECLNLELKNVDFDNLLIIVTGKGRKERIVPISIELRKVLHRFITKQRVCRFQSPYLFCTSTGTTMSYHNTVREFMKVVRSLGLEGFDGCFHAFRRFFGKNYLKNGGNLVYLQRLFGHSNIATTKMYLEDIDQEDLHRVHLQTSVLGRLG
jgi:integrase/recombinase XerD